MNSTESITFIYAGMKHERRGDAWFRIQSGQAFEVSMQMSDIIDNAYEISQAMNIPAPSEIASQPAAEVKADAPDIPEPSAEPTGYMRPCEKCGGSGTDGTRDYVNLCHGCGGTGIHELDKEDTARFTALDVEQVDPPVALIDRMRELHSPIPNSFTSPAPAELTAPAPTLDAVLGVPAPVAINPSQDVTVSTDPTPDLFAESISDLLAANQQQAGEIVKLLEIVKQREGEIAKLSDELTKERKISAQARSQVKELKAANKLQSAAIEKTADGYITLMQTISACRLTEIAIRKAFAIQGELTPAAIIDAVKAMPNLFPQAAPETTEGPKA